MSPIVIAGPGVPDREYLTVTGQGSTRDAALKDANSQAFAYFGETKVLTRTVGRAEPRYRLVDGTVLLWSIDCEYRLDPKRGAQS